MSGRAELTLPAINCPKPGGNVSVETTKVTSAGYSRRLRGRRRQQRERRALKMKTINIGHNYPGNIM